LHFCNNDEQGNSKSQEGKIKKNVCAIQGLCIDETGVLESLTKNSSVHHVKSVTDVV
jgi:hypothetical protein